MKPKVYFPLTSRESGNNFDRTPCCELAARSFGWNTQRPVGEASLNRGAELASRVESNNKKQHVLKET